MNNFYLSRDEAVLLRWNLKCSLCDFAFSEDDDKMFCDIISRIEKLLEENGEILS